MLLKLLNCSQRRRGKELTNSAKICIRILIHVCRLFSFKTLVVQFRLLSRGYKSFVEKYVDKIHAKRELYYRMEPGYVYPTRNNKIIQLTNVVHLHMYHYFPDYNQWLFNYMFSREFHLCIDTLNHRRTTLCYNLFKYKTMKSFKLMNLRIIGFYVSGMASRAEECYFQNVAFWKIDPQIVKSDCKKLTIINSSNLQHLHHTKFINAREVCFQKSDVSQDTLNQILGPDVVEQLTIKEIFSFNDDMARFLALEANFIHITELDLSRNRIGFQGLCYLMSSTCAFANSITILNLEGNIISASLTQIMTRMQLPEIRYLDLNMNQIEWDENSSCFEKNTPPPIQTKADHNSVLSQMTNKGKNQGSLFSRQVNPEEVEYLGTQVNQQASQRLLQNSQMPQSGYGTSTKYSHFQGPTGWKIVKRMKEKKHISQLEWTKVRSCEIQIGDLIVKVMSGKDLFLD